MQTEGEGRRSLQVERHRPQVVLVASDRSLREEFQSALDGVTGCDPVLTFVSSSRQASEVARSTKAALVCIEMSDDVERVTTLAEELRSENPGCIVTVAYRRDAFPNGALESGALIRVIRSGVQDLIKSPPSSAELERLLERVSGRRVGNRSRTNGSVFSFVSNKGGVGKSTVSVNTAATLARRRPGAVLLVDGSLQLGVCAPMLGLEPTRTIVDVAREVDRLDPEALRRLVLRHESGLHLLAAPEDAAAASFVTDEVMGRILSIARKTYETVIVDTFPMLDRVIMTVLDASEIAYVVIQGTVPNVVGADRLLKTLEGIGIPPARQRVVVSENYADFAGNLRVADVEERLDRDVDHRIPYQKRLVKAMNAGMPWTLRHRIDGFSRGVRRIVDEIESMLPPHAPLAPRDVEPQPNTASVPSPPPALAKPLRPEPLARSRARIPVDDETIPLLPSDESVDGSFPEARSAKTAPETFPGGPLAGAPETAAPSAVDPRHAVEEIVPEGDDPDVVPEPSVRAAAPVEVVDAEEEDDAVSANERADQLEVIRRRLQAEAARLRESDAPAEDADGPILYDEDDDVQPGDGQPSASGATATSPVVRPRPAAGGPRAEPPTRAARVATPQTTGAGGTPPGFLHRLSSVFKRGPRPVAGEPEPESEPPAATPAAPPVSKDGAQVPSKLGGNWDFFAEE